ncbi:MAG: hypothetical protein L0H93_15090 [Nocardioides sp.]|nr:hypothetical protein [Nocardioides sp.]
MSRRVFLHIGLPKTGTTYLQTIVWSHRPELERAGLLVPGRERRDHLWASMVIRDDPKVARRDPRAPGSWQVILDQTARWDADALISHEFFAAASSEQAERMIESLAPAEVHVVLTAREPLGLFTSSWQESLKNKGTKRLENYGREESADPQAIWNWRTLDIGLVLERWAPHVPAERVHIITMPERDAPKDALWRRFAKLLGVDPAIADGAEPFPNASMGVVEAEALRRINERLQGFQSAFDRGVWIRSFLADDRLVPRGGDRFWPGDEQVADARRRGRAAVHLIHDRGFDVIGDLDGLLVPHDLPERRHPSSVTDAEVAEVTVALSAQLLGDLKERLGTPGGSSSGAGKSGGSRPATRPGRDWGEAARSLWGRLRRLGR